MSGFHQLSVKKITQETNSSVSIAFNLPEALKPTFAFKAGQYITLKASINGTEERRDYSLCVPPNSTELKVAVKEVDHGTFSHYVNNTLTVGDTLEVGAPKGRFTFEPHDAKTKNIALFAAGSGITPIMSIIKCALQEETQCKIILVYGNKSAKDTMFIEELLDLQNTHKDRFFMQLVFSQSEDENAIFGRIEKSTVNYILKNKHKDVNIDAFYLCGPEGMIYSVKDVLIDNGILENHIYFELFTTSTASDNNAEPTTQSTGHTALTIIVDDEETTFTMPQKQTVLEAALHKDLDVPYSCQGGICSSCLAKIKEGAAHMRLNTILTESEINEGLILTCQAQPTTPKLIVDYDDV